MKAFQQLQRLSAWCLAVLLLITNSLGSLHALEFHVEDHHHEYAVYGEICSGSDHHSCALDHLLRVPLPVLAQFSESLAGGLDFSEEAVGSTSGCLIQQYFCRSGPPRAPPGLIA